MRFTKGVCDPGHVPTPPRPQTGFARPALPQEPAAPFWRTGPITGLLDASAVCRAAHSLLRQVTPREQPESNAFVSCPTCSCRGMLRRTAGLSWRGGGVRDIHGSGAMRCELGSLCRMTAIVRIALRRPYTFVVLALLILIIGPLAALRTPVDIFPEISIPVIAIDLAIHRPAAGRDGRPHGHAVRTRADHDGQRHRAYRGQLL